MGIKNVIGKIGEKAGDKVAKLSSLSPAQVENVQLLREKYLLEMPNPNDPTAREQTERLMAASSVEIFNAYLPQIKELYLPIDNKAEYGKEFDVSHNIRYINITKWVTDKNENNLEKLVNVYAVLSNEDCNIALVFNRKKNTTNVYLAVVNNKNSSSSVNADNYKEQIIEALRGNFPGAEWKEDGFGILPCFQEEKKYSVATASNIPTEKSEKFISQTIEKLLDGTIPETNKKEYTIVLLATPILDVEERKLKLGEFYSGMAPYASWSTSFQMNENQSTSSSATVGVNIGASAGVQNGINSSITDTQGTTDSTSRTDTESESDTETENESLTENESEADSKGTSETDTDTKGSSDNVGVSASGTLVAGGGIMPASASTTVGASYNHGWNRSTSKAIGKTAMKTITKGTAKTLGKSTGKTVGTAVANTLGRALTRSMAVTQGVTKAINLGGNIGANFARSSTTTVMLGKNEGITQNYTNFNVQHILELLKEQMKRFEQSSALGMWDFAAYVVSEDSSVANNVAHSYLALTLGEESYMSKSAINTWRGNVEEEADQAKEICEYIKTLRHPVFGLNPGIIGKVEDGEVKVEVDEEDKDSFIVYPPIITATTSLSGKELAYSLNFPQKSIVGLPILECVEFGRNIVTYDAINENARNIELGKVFHMNHIEDTTVQLDLDSLSSHVFVTGSTGSGKSNTIYQIINEAKDKGVKILVIEPAKGEYKNIFGNSIDFEVYGTNPRLSSLLRINPFSFPKETHVLEHLDRVTEIFNVCWPMYAAMPAVLKSAIERAYISCGWDLVKSINKYGEEIYPTFLDIAANIKEIINTSEYDDENKGAYKGALLTRLNSLTTGINGLIFSSEEISYEDLFDSNVIVDLSRVGSTETKSLIMGLLVLKMQEYRMTNNNGMNAKLRHLTILEEAHNLLRRTSSTQTQDTANLQGKSVEMLSNAIAEMRTYGEGFVIADQAPGLMDMSVIRNTNTKIVMRLPDQNDRELVGKAANLNNDQIEEVSKIPCGVAVIYQNEWIQPILCKVQRYSDNSDVYDFDNSLNKDIINKNEELSKSLLECIMDKELFQIGDKEDLHELKNILIKSRLDSVVKIDFLKYIESEKGKGLEALRCLIYDFLNAQKAIEDAKSYADINEWVDAVVSKLEPSVENYSDEQLNLIILLILQEQTLRDYSYRNVLNSYIEIYRNGGIVH